MHVAKCNTDIFFFHSVNNRFLAIELSLLALTLYSPVQKLLNTDFVCVFKTEPTCSHLRVAGGEPLAATATAERVSFPLSDARGQEALTKNVASPPVICPCVSPLQGKMSFCKVMRSQFHTEPYHSPFPSWAQTNSLFKQDQGRETYAFVQLKIAGKCQKVLNLAANPTYLADILA